MATVPTTAEIQEYIFEYIRQSGSNPRAGEIAGNITQMQIYCQTNHGTRAQEFQTALNDLIQNGYFTYKSGSTFVMLTDKGFARL